MKRYGYNWLLMVLGIFLILCPFAMWLRLVGGLLLSPEKPIDWSNITWFGFQQSLTWASIMFFAASNNHKKRLEALGATENTPVRTETDNADTPKKAKVVPYKQSMWYFFGGASAIVGPVSMITHLITGRICAAEVVGFTMIIPLCCIAGGWLTDKALLKERQNAAAPHGAIERVYGMPAYAQTLGNLSSDEEQAPLINRRG